ncbi:MAG: FG-GAP-like repeat-containing protein [Saprospiraceae bacterium]|nr:FG-GAP-like repeat-containing protein [Saprospiraceae bacterium]
MRSLSALAFLILSSLSVHGQPTALLTWNNQANPPSKQLTCGFDEQLATAEKIDPALYLKRQEAESRWQVAFRKGEQFSARSGILTLPIVFHIIHNNGAENVADAAVMASVSNLNAAFQNVAPYGPSAGVATQFQFCMAQQDPNGMPTTGVDRFQNSLTVMDKDFQDLAVKDLVRWDPGCYINVWVVAEINSSASGNSVAGYATFPQSHGTLVDGIVIEAKYLGSNPENTVVLIHEMGHYLGLYHTFEGGCSNADCTQDGDRVCDTPPDQSTAHVACPIGMNSCTTDAQSGYSSDQQDQIENYMDYSDLSCYDRFTQGQSDRMDFMFGQFRTSLLDCPSCLPVCNDPVTAAFQLMPNPVMLGSTTFATNNSSANAITYQWYQSGNPVSTLMTPNFTPTSPGIYPIVLQATGMDTFCFGRDTVFLEVQCPFQAKVSGIPSGCIPDGTISDFTYTGTTGAILQWWLDGLPVSTLTTYSIQLTPGIHTLTLAASGASCGDTASWILPVGCMEICDNGFDDDLDGLIDCFDPDCCGQCDDFYFDPCLHDPDCTDPYCDVITAKEKWRVEFLTVFVYTGAVGDITGDGKPDILSCGFDKQMRLIANDGSSVMPIGPMDVNWIHSPAIADVDRDGDGEIFYINEDNWLVRMEHDGTITWTSTQPAYISGTLANYQHVHIFDLNQDGNPEIITNKRVFDSQTGAVLASGGPGVSTGILSTGTSAEGYLTCADMHPNPGLEIITGNQVLGVNWTLGTLDILMSFGNFDGSASVVDWDQDGDLDIVTAVPITNVPAISRKVLVWDGQTPTLLGQATISEVFSSPPMVANLDDDPELEIALSGYEPFVGGFVMAYDHNFTVMWKHSVKELSGCMPVGFDFCDDGPLEVVVRSMDYLDILDGATGTILFRDTCGSITNDEHPLIADIDLDGHAEIICHCNNPDPSSAKYSVRAYEGDLVEWAPTRPIWNQYMFSNNHINDDLTVPSYQQEIHLPAASQGLGQFQTAFTIGQYRDSIDFEVSVDSVWCAGGESIWLIQVCNDGLFPMLAKDVVFSWYTGDPRLVGSQFLHVDTFSLPLILPGDCLDVTISPDPAWSGGTDSLWLIWNDPGSLSPPFLPSMALSGYQGECNYTNNGIGASVKPSGKGPDLGSDTLICGAGVLALMVSPGWSLVVWNDSTSGTTYLAKTPGWHWVVTTDQCGYTYADSLYLDRVPQRTLDLPDTIIQCETGVVPLNAGAGFLHYQWSDYSTDSTFTAWTPGLYWVEVQDSCQQIFRDTVIVKLAAGPAIQMPDTLLVCSGDSVNLAGGPFSFHIWQSLGGISCDTCLNTKWQGGQSELVHYTGLTTEGCAIYDSVYIEVGSFVSSLDTQYLCSGDSLFWDHSWITHAGIFTDTIPSSSGCDTLANLRVLSPPVPGYALGQIWDCAAASGSVWVNLDPSEKVLIDWGAGLPKTDSLSGIPAGLYSVMLVDQWGCITLDSVVLEASPGLQFSIPAQIVTIPGATIQLAINGDTTVTGTTIEWTPLLPAFCAHCFSQSFSVQSETLLEIVIVDSSGCRYELSTLVILDVNDDHKVFLPNVFSPNGDGINDLWQIQPSGPVQSWELNVFDRWGNQVYLRKGGQQDLQQFGWDGSFRGEEMDPGVFVFEFSILWLDGSTTNRAGEMVLIK